MIAYYLKYRIGPDFESLPSYIHLPRIPEADKIFLGLESLDHESGVPVEIRLNRDRPEDFVLGLGKKTEAHDRAFTSLERTASEQNPLLLTLESYPEVPKMTDSNY